MTEVLSCAQSSRVGSVMPNFSNSARTVSVAGVQSRVVHLSQYSPMTYLERENPSKVPPFSMAIRLDARTAW